MSQKAIKIKITVGNDTTANQARESKNTISEEYVIRPNYQGISVILLIGALLFGGGWLVFSSSPEDDPPSSVAVTEPSEPEKMVYDDVHVPAVTNKAPLPAPTKQKQTIIVADSETVIDPDEQPVVKLDQHLPQQEKATSNDLMAEIPSEEPAEIPDEVNNHEYVGRAQFTWGISKREPVDKVQRLSLDNKEKEHKSVKLYFFSELKGLKGKTVTHRWLFEDKEMARVKFRVGGDRWRVYSSKNIQTSRNGTWSVVISDDQGNELYRNSVQAK